MEDDRIVDLYWARNEQAIAESERKYGRLLRSVSYACLGSREDAEECANDTYLEAWNAMPTARPQFLGAFLSKITRRISIDRFRRDHRTKRGGAEALTAELTDCLPDPAEPTLPKPTTPREPAMRSTAFWRDCRPTAEPCSSTAISSAYRLPRLPLRQGCRRRTSRSSCTECAGS